MDFERKNLFKRVYGKASRGICVAFLQMDFERENLFKMGL